MSRLEIFLDGWFLAEYSAAGLRFSRYSQHRRLGIDIFLESYRTSVPLMPTRPYVRKEIVEKALKVSRNEAARRAEAEKFYDNSFVKTLDDSGFITALFGSQSK